MFVVEGRKGTDFIMEGFDNLEEATKALEEMLKDGYDAAILYP